MVKVTLPFWENVQTPAMDGRTRTPYGAEGWRRGALIFPIIKAAAATDVGWTLRRSVLRPPYLCAAAPPSERGWLSSSVNEASHLMVSVDTAGGRWASKGGRREGGRRNGRWLRPL